MLASLHTEFGYLTVVAENEAIIGLEWTPAAAAPDAGAVLTHAVAALRAYCDAGVPLPLHLPLAPRGTPFQQRVWRRLRAIPHGRTATYAALAAELGTAPRALAGACAANPLPIFIPCHRVVGSDGRLGGYSGGEGIATKAALLRHEGVCLDALKPAAPLFAETSPA